MLNLAGCKQIKGITPFGHIRFLYNLAAVGRVEEQSLDYIHYKCHILFK